MRVRLTGVVPTVAITKVLVCLLSSITTAAAAVARNASSLSPTKVQLHLLFALQEIEPYPNIGFSVPLCGAMDGYTREAIGTLMGTRGEIHGNFIYKG